MIKLATKITLIFFALLALQLVFVDLFNKYSPQEYWFEYHPPKVVTVEKENGNINFHSNAEIKQPMYIEWQDTLWCNESDGTYGKYPTQVWKEYKFERSLEEETANWGYLYFPERDGKRSCQMCGTIIGKSRPTVFKPNGYDKIDNYCTKEFTY
jgi:hypothetical protein